MYPSGRVQGRFFFATMHKSLGNQTQASFSEEDPATGNPPLDIAASSSVRSLEQVPKCVADLPSGMWAEYRRYHACAYNLTGNGARIADEPKILLLARMVHEKASCFWIASALACRTGAVQRLRREYAAELVDPREGVTPAQALRICKLLGIGLYQHSLTDFKVDVTLRHPKKQEFQPGIMQVVVNDRGEFAPHFLPVSRLKEDPAVLTKTELRRIGRELGVAVEVSTPVSSSPSSVRSSSGSDVVDIHPSRTTSARAASGTHRTTASSAGLLALGDVFSAQGTRLSSIPPSIFRIGNVFATLGDEVPAEAEDVLLVEEPAQGNSAAVIPAADRSRTRVRTTRRDRTSASAAVGSCLPPAGFLPVTTTGKAKIPWCAVARGREAPPIEVVGPHGLYTMWQGGSTSESSPGCFPASETLGFETRLLMKCSPMMFEARREVLVGAKIKSGDLVYTRVREGAAFESPDVKMLGGAICLDRLDQIQTANETFILGPITNFEMKGRQYEVAELKRSARKESLLGGFVKRCIRKLLLLPSEEELEKKRRDPGQSLLAKVVSCTIFGACLEQREEVIDLSTDKVQTGLPKLADLAELPDDAARVRTAYVLMKQYVPEQVIGPMIDVRSNHLALANPQCVEPAAVVADLVRADYRLRKGLGELKCFSYPPAKQHKNCQCCGVAPPPIQYRWKHRICNSCWRMLRTLGYTSYSGSQLQDNLHVPTCYPGIVMFRGSQYPPPVKKWAGCNLNHGKSRDAPGVWVAPGYANRKLEFGEKVQGWRKAELSDLEKLRQPDPEQKLFALAGIACSGAMPMVSAQTDYNRFKAVAGRLFRQQAPADWGSGPKPGQWAEARRFLDILLTDLDAPVMSFEDWLASMPSRRRRALATAQVNFLRRGLRDGDAKFKAFVKTELLPGFKQELASGAYSWKELDRLDSMLDRLINGPADVTHCIAGPILKPKMKRLKQLWHKDAHIVYGGAGPEVLARLLERLQFGNGEFFWCDFSMFDNTHSEETWALMESLYGDHGVDFKAVLNMWRAPCGKIGPFKYQAKVMNASGRDDTALANAVLNGIATFLSLCCALVGKDLSELTRSDVYASMPRIVLSVCGDDSIGKVLGLSDVSAFRAAFNAQIRAFGFEAKLETAKELSKAVYLGMRPYPTAAGWFWGKTIGRATYKMGFVQKPMQRDVMAHITGVADMHCLCSRHVPILYDLAAKICELRQGAKRTPVLVDENKPWEWVNQGAVPYDSITIASVAEAYTALSGAQIQSEDVLDLIRCIASVNRLPCVLDHWLWKLIIACDDL